MSATNPLPDQSDVLAQLETANKKVTTLGNDLLTAKTTIGSLQGQVETLTGDKTKLTAGVILPADLVSAANEIFTLKAEKQTLDAAVAKRLAALGIKDNPAATAKTQDEKKLTLTERVLAAQGCKTLAESREKFLKANALSAA